MMNVKCTENRFKKVNQRKKKKAKACNEAHRVRPWSGKQPRRCFIIMSDATAIAFPLPWDSLCAHCADVSCETLETNRWKAGGGDLGSRGEINEVRLARSIQNPVEPIWADRDGTCYRLRPGICIPHKCRLLNLGLTVMVQRRRRAQTCNLQKK